MQWVLAAYLEFLDFSHARHVALVIPGTHFFAILIIVLHVNVLRCSSRNIVPWLSCGRGIFGGSCHREGQ